MVSNLSTKLASYMIYNDDNIRFQEENNPIKSYETLEHMLDMNIHVDTDTEAADIYTEIFETEFNVESVPEPVSMSDSTLTDMQLELWCKKQGFTQGGSYQFYKMVSQPTKHKPLLLSRQKQIKKAKTKWVSEMKELAAMEKDILWIYTLPEKIHKMWPLPLLFPSMPIFRRINHSHNSLYLFHLYRIWLSPILQIVIPIITILGPWFYLRFRMGMKLTLLQYFQLMKFLLQQSMTGSWKEKSSRVFTIVMYGLMFLYGIIQSIEISRMLHNVRKKLLQRIDAIHKFIDKAHILLVQWLPSCRKPDIPKNMAGIYAILQNQSLRKDITQFMKQFYEFDVALSCKVLITKHKWSFVKYALTNTNMNKIQMFYDMRNPLLSSQQQSNPFYLQKNLIITGPNAAGKSTYVRSIGANLIFAHTLGICCARFGMVEPVSAIMSYMRVRDVIGTGSLFEAEVAHCANIIKVATDLEKSGETGIIFFDEPMHSTPPIEGESAAYAVMEYLGNLSNMRTIVTSHYHRITTLASSHPEHPTRWTNMCMDAIYDKTVQKYTFPYRIRSGASYQSIALELLKDKDTLPASVVQNALKFKSTMYKSRS